MKKTARAQENQAEPTFSFSETLDFAREHVSLAAAMLQRLGPDQARVAWMLEDALTFLDESYEAPVLSMADAEKLVSASAKNRKQAGKKKRPSAKR